MTRTWLGHDSGVGAIGGGPGGAGYMLVSGFDSGSTLDHPRRILRVALVSHPPPSSHTPRTNPYPAAALPGASLPLVRAPQARQGSGERAGPD